MKKLWSSVALVAVVLAVALLAQTSAGQALMRDVGLSKTPAGYTQLSFARPQSLPATVPSSGATVRVPFKIRNSSGTQHTYRWSVTAAHGQSTGQLSSGSTQVRAGAEVTVTPAVTVSCANGRVRLNVGLASPRESIDFYATCASSSSASTSSASSTGGTS
jgi:hypothetical protein